MRIYILTYASVSIHNNIYLFNINSCKLDGHYRSYSEYLNERYICMHTWQVNKIAQYYNVHHWHVLKSYKHNITQKNTGFDFCFGIMSLICILFLLELSVYSLSCPLHNSWIPWRILKQLSTNVYHIVAAQQLLLNSEFSNC